jgi:hypothetical protein
LQTVEKVPSAAMNAPVHADHGFAQTAPVPESRVDVPRPAAGGAPPGPVEPRVPGRAGQRVAVPDLLDALVADGLVDPEDALRTALHARMSTADQHALVAIAHRKLRNARPPHRTLTWRR